MRLLIMYANISRVMLLTEIENLNMWSNYGLINETENIAR
jgi:hypothetical protein